MGDFQVRADAVDVEAIMRQIRARVREKRGVDYTEAEVQELAKVKLEQFLDPKGVRSDLVAQFRRKRAPQPALPNYKFEDSTIYDTHRGLLRALRRLFNPLLKLLFNPNPISDALHIQGKLNDAHQQRLREREDMDALYYELVHNLSLEITRLGIEVHNLKMRTESLSSRLDFDERRGRALESVVQYRQPRAPQPSATQVVAPPAGHPTTDGPAQSPTEGASGASQGDAERRRRRRRRRRRPGQTFGDAQAAGASVDAGPDPGDDDRGPDGENGGGVDEQ